MTDFAAPEFRARVERAQAAMAQADFDALFLTTEAELRYFTGFRTLFWQSPARPWFLIVPANGDPVAIIPSIGADLMAKTWISDIRTWPSPRPDDEGISLLLEALQGCARIAMPMGEEASLRMPPADFDRLRTGLNAELADATPLIKRLRMMKSPAEIAHLRSICQIGSAAFARVPGLVQTGQPLAEAFRAFKIALLQEGAEEVPYLVGGAGQGGYGDVISPAGTTPLLDGDVLMLDTGATLAGYFCDFDRNFAIGHADQPARDAYRALWSATEAGLAAARPGASCADLFAAMAAELPGAQSAVGRFGHGLGMQLTEWPSIMPNDHTILEPGMVMTLEPSLVYGGGLMQVHEENILITDGGAELLTRRAAPDLPVI
ncbi:MAG: aminopeptidase P family protein [Rhodobacteraceae bacterium]|nr:aminopeptidase P family protein [Paracoccaceae bacterium]